MVSSTKKKRKNSKAMRTDEGEDPPSVLRLFAAARGPEAQPTPTATELDQSRPALKSAMKRPKQKSPLGKVSFDPCSAREGVWTDPPMDEFGTQYGFLATGDRGTGGPTAKAGMKAARKKVKLEASTSKSGSGGRKGEKTKLVSGKVQAGSP